ncbi:hypothetical protein MIDIC_230098 [Alphaproteobacteria bacterium]
MQHSTLFRPHHYVLSAHFKMGLGMNPQVSKGGRVVDKGAIRLTIEK